MSIYVITYITDIGRFYGNINGKRCNDGPTRQSLYNLNAALLENPPEIFDFEGTIKLLKKLVSKYYS